jgi:4-amino-4-deoxy-L-arabinose transferase-like glycosyltransferase
MALAASRTPHDLGDHRVDGGRVTAPVPGRRAEAVLAAVILALVAMTLRLFHLHTAYDIQVDEITYLRISESVASSLRTELYGQAFFLHPPLFFYIEAAWLHLFPPTGNVVEDILVVRALNVLFAGGTAALLFLTAWRLAGMTGGAVAAGVFALDPFMIKITSWNMLEASTVFWVLLGLAVIILAAGPEGQLSRRAALLAGLAFGLGLLSKEESAFICLLPCCAWMVIGSRSARRLLLTLGAAVLTYSVYPVVTAMNGGLGGYLSAKLTGAARLVGIIQESGFHEPGNQSFLAAVADRASEFGATYLIIGLGVLATGFLWRKGGRDNRLLAAWMGSAMLLLSYALAFGTLEEQMFYLLVVPSALAIGVAVPQLLQHWSGRRRHGLVRGTVLAVGLVFAIVAVTVWCQTHLVPDNGYETLVAWLDAHLPVGTPVSVAPQAPAFLMSQQQTGQWLTPSDLARHRAQYVVTSTTEVSEGYVPDSGAFFRWVRDHSQVVFSFPGRIHGTIVVYRLDGTP